jgi:murein L,D-transpeptidase YcbB/YkuD
MVNIPEFLVRIVEGGATVYEDRVIVGKPTNQTPIFSKAMQHVIVNPYWNVPTSIAVKEMLPRLAADPGYFARQGFELVNARGHVVSPYAVNWRAVTAGRFRFRQPPGERNALGRIKFMLPNEHDVYIHDTPTRSLFANAIRAYSHGCIRVHEPFRFADALLADQGIDGARLKKLIGGPERTLMLKRHIPVHIVYFTAGVGKDGKVEARPDIYGHDARLKATLGLH